MVIVDHVLTYKNVNTVHFKGREEVCACAALQMSNDKARPRHVCP